MATIPTLGEINAYRPDAELGGSSPRTIIDNRETVRLLNEAANQKAQNDWNKYLVFQNNLKDVYKNLGDISALETATPDKDYLNKQAAEIYQEISENPKDFFSGGGKYNEIQQKISKLRSDATESKLNNVYDFTHREYINRNPELNTPENQQQINDYLNQPLGKRKAYSLNLPTIFDVGEYAKGILDNPAVKTTIGEEPSLVGADGLSPGDAFIKEGGESIKYGKDAFMNAWMAGLESQQDKYHHPIANAVQQRFNALPKDVQKEQYNNDPKEYFKHLGEMAFGSDQDIYSETKPSTLKPNTNLYAKEKLGIEYSKAQTQRMAANALAAERYASAALSNKKAKALDQQFNPPQAFNEIFKGRMKLETTQKGDNINRIYLKDMPKELRDVLGIDPVNKTNGFYNVIPANISINGKSMDEGTAKTLYKDWLRTAQARKIARATGKVPDIFDALFANGATFEVEVEGKIPILLDKQGNQVGGGEVTRSNALQAWINQRKQLGIKGDKLLNVDNNNDDNTEIDNQ